MTAGSEVALVDPNSTRLPGATQAASAIVDPRLRRIVDGPTMCSVIAPTCVVADGLTKVLAITGRLDPALLRAFDAAERVH